MDDMITEIKNTVDRILYDVVGIKPAEKLVTIAEKIAPANVLSEITGISKPESTLGKAFQDVDSTASKLKRRPF